MKSVLFLLKKYRKRDINIVDSFSKLKKKNLKVTNFSSIFYITEDTTSKAYYDPHLHTVVIINNDGFIDNIIYLYDKKMKVFDSVNIEDKLNNLLENYYFSTKYNFIESLYKNGFISYYVYTKLKRECL